MNKSSLLLLSLLSTASYITAMLESATIQHANSTLTSTTESATQTCEICCDDINTNAMYKRSCSHEFCLNCLRHIIRNAAREESLIPLRCPKENCDAFLTLDEIAQIGEISQQEMNQLSQLLKSVNQENALIELTPENQAWLAIHTEPCPKCKEPIEKNGGCLHMTCKKCAHQFYWCCKKDYPIPGHNWYTCSNNIVNIPANSSYLEIIINRLRNNLSDISYYVQDRARQLASDSLVRDAARVGISISITAAISYLLYKYCPQSDPATSRNSTSRRPLFMPPPWLYQQPPYYPPVMPPQALSRY